MCGEFDLLLLKGKNDAWCPLLSQFYFLSVLYFIFGCAGSAAVRARGEWGLLSS